MHPLLANRTRSLLYAAAWLPIAAGLTHLLTLRGDIARSGAAAVVFPMALIYACICLASWYLCKATPLRRRDSVRLAVSHLTAATASAAVWMLFGWIWAWMLQWGVGIAGLASWYASESATLFWAGCLLFWMAAVFHYLLISLETSQKAERKALELQVLARDAELKALRAQIDPHFLFNSLNSISALVLRDPAAARDMCVLLADFLRGSLKLGSQQRISLGDEIQLADSYLNIERVRFGARLTLVREIESGCEACPVPPLILQPLVENAITHGIGSALHGGVVSLRAERSAAGLRVVVENPCSSENGEQNGAGVGLKNVRLRLANVYQDDARMDISRTDGRFRVELQIPCDVEEPL